LDNSSNELHPDHFLIIYQLVNPAQNIKDFIASQASHVSTGNNLNSFLLVNNVKLRNYCKSLKPDRKTPKVLEIVVGFGRSDVEQNGQY
jgi:hypothetical protein